MKGLIVIEGYPASGKSTFARRLSEELKVPCFIKDTFKIALCRSVGHVDRAQSDSFSAVTFDAIIYSAERLMENGLPVIIEGNFVPKGKKALDENGVIAALIEKYAYPALSFKFIADTNVLFERFNARERTPQRGQANMRGVPYTYEDFCYWCHKLDGFTLPCETLTLDTTDFDSVDFAAMAEKTRLFLTNKA